MGLLLEGRGVGVAPAYPVRTERIERRRAGERERVEHAIAEMVEHEVDPGLAGGFHAMHVTNTRRQPLGRGIHRGRRQDLFGQPTQVPDPGRRSPGGGRGPPYPGGPVSILGPAPLSGFRNKRENVGHRRYGAHRKSGAGDHQYRYFPGFGVFPAAGRLCPGYQHPGRPGAGSQPPGSGCSGSKSNTGHCCRIYKLSYSAIPFSAPAVVGTISPQRHQFSRLCRHPGDGGGGFHWAPCRNKTPGHRC